MKSKRSDNYHFRLLLGLCCIAVLGLFLLPPATPDSEFWFLKTTWEYAWGDAPIAETQQRKWLPAEPLREPPGKNGENILWLRVTLPPEPVKAPLLYLKFVQQTYEIYMDDGRLIHRYGTVPAPVEERVRPWLPLHFISLPEDAPGKQLYFRISSAAPSIGIMGVAGYGSTLGFFRYNNPGELAKTATSSLLLAAGLLSLIVYAFFRRESMYAAFAGNALLSSGLSYASTHNSFLLYPNPDFWNYFILFCALGWKVFWLQFVTYICPPRHYRLTQQMVRLTAILFAGIFLASLLRPAWTETLFLWHMPYSLLCLLLVVYVCHGELKHNREAQFYAAGTTVWVVASTLDALGVLGLIYMPVLIVWVGQVAEAAGVGAVLILRYRKIRHTLVAYSGELESLSREMEQRVAERTAAIHIEKNCLEQLFHNAPVAYAALNSQNKITNVNPEFERVFGFTREETLGADIYRLLDVSDDAGAEENIFSDGHLSESRYAYVVRHHKNSTPLTVSMAAYPFVAQDGQYGTYVVYRDVSYQAAAAQQLRENEKKYRLLAANMGDIIWLVDAEWKFLYISPSTEKVLGFPAPEFLALPLQERLTPALQAALAEVTGRSSEAQDSTGPLLLDEERQHRDGSPIWLESSISPAYGENGEELGILIVSRDITVRKRTEKLLSSAYEQKRKSRFFEAILDGTFTNTQDIYAEARRLRLYLPPFFAVGFILLIAPEAPDEKDKLLDEAADILSGLTGISAWNASNGIGFIAGLSPQAERRKEEASLSQLCITVIKMQHPLLSLSIGLGDYADGFTDFISRFRHARTAARIGSRRQEEESILWYEECGIEEIFDYFAGKREAAAFVSRTLGPLLEYDRQANGELLATLERLLAGMTLKEISEQMFVHHKTVALRKQRIEALLGLSLDSFENCLCLGAALQIRKILLTETSDI